MNQEQNNLNPNNFNTQGNIGMPNNQPLNNQSFNQGMGVNQQQINPQPQPAPSFQQPIMLEPTPQPMNNTFDSGNASNQSFNSKPPKKINLGLIIGIVAVVAVVGVGVAFGSKLLSNGGNNSNNDSTPSTNANNNVGNNSGQTDTNSKDWDADGEWFPNNENGSSKYYIDLPTFGGMGKLTGAGRLAIQRDGAIIIYSGQQTNSPSIKDISELFPTYFQYVELTLNDLYGLFAKDNYKFIIDDSSTITVNEYEMQRFKGKIEFDKEIYDDGGNVVCPFTAYATKLKSNGAYAWWIVYYDSDEDFENSNLNSATLDSKYALPIAKSFREEK